MSFEAGDPDFPKCDFILRVLMLLALLEKGMKPSCIIFISLSLSQFFGEFRTQFIVQSLM